MKTVQEIRPEVLSDLIVSCRENSKIISYKKLLERENERLNLVSRETFPDGFFRLAAESILPLQYLNNVTHGAFLDIGSGGGLPAFPIIANSSIKKAVLVERIGKKAAAIDRIAKEMPVETKIEVISRNLDEIKFSHKFDLITIRLVKLTDNLLKKALSLLNPGGIIIYYFKPEQKQASGLSVVTYSYSTSPESNNKFFSIITKK